jgi:hypothetical protein
MYLPPLNVTKENLWYKKREIGMEKEKDEQKKRRG